MNQSELGLWKVLFLTLIVAGAFTFLFAWIYWNKDILFLSLIQLMCGSVGYYLINNNSPKLPYHLKSKNV